MACSIQQLVSHSVLASELRGQLPLAWSASLLRACSHALEHTVLSACVVTTVLSACVAAYCPECMCCSYPQRMCCSSPSKVHHLAVGCTSWHFVASSKLSKLICSGPVSAHPTAHTRTYQSLGVSSVLLHEIRCCSSTRFTCVIFIPSECRYSRTASHLRSCQQQCSFRQVSCAVLCCSPWELIRLQQVC